jgi:hypothetical protein
VTIVKFGPRKKRPADTDQPAVPSSINWSPFAVEKLYLENVTVW